MSQASELFDLMIKFNQKEEEIDNKLLEIMEDKEWNKVQDISFDWYDNSFEFKGCSSEFIPSSKQLKQFKKLGFSRCWFCYIDGTEKYFTL
jgi:hypothetical protein